MALVRGELRWLRKLGREIESKKGETTCRPLQTLREARLGGMSIHEMLYFSNCEFTKVEEVAEIIGLPPCDEFLSESQNLHKVDVPHVGVALNLVPAFNSWNWRIEDHGSPRRVWITAHECVGDVPAYVMSDNVHMLQVERVRNLLNVFRRTSSPPFFLAEGSLRKEPVCLRSREDLLAPVHPSQNGAPVVAEADFESDQLLRIGSVSHGQNCANTHVDLVKNVWRDRLLDLRGFHLTILSSQVSLIIPAPQREQSRRLSGHTLGTKWREAYH